MTIIQIADRYKVSLDEVKCSQCKHCRFSSIDLEKQVCICEFWDQKMLCKSFCNHFVNR